MCRGDGESLTVEHDICDALDERVLFALSGEEGSGYPLMMREDLCKVSEDFLYESWETRFLYDWWRGAAQAFDKHLILWSTKRTQVIDMISPVGPPPDQRHTLFPT